MYRKLSLSDIPFSAGINDLGTEQYVNGLIKFIENSSTPITIALQGEWGSGKTSLMNKLYDSLCGEGKSFRGISINTWEYSMLSTPEVAVVKILEYLITALSANDEDSDSKFKKYVNGLGNIVFRAGRESFKLATGPVGAVLTEAFVGDGIDVDAKKEKISLSDLRMSLNKAITNSLSEDKQGVIVFVDDLDRLNPPLAVEILELLKNVFTLDNCIFILAIDYDVVVKGLKPKFGELTEKNEREFRSFFDKIIQVPFSLPVSNYRPMDFLLNSLVEVGYIKDIDRSNPNVRDTFAKIVESSVGKNPRSIKRLINTLSLLDCIACSGSAIEEFSIYDKILNFIVVAIQICYPKIYRMLTQKPGFTSWDAAFASKMGIILTKNNDGQESLHWEEVLEASCAADIFLTKHLNDIAQLLNLIIEILGRTNQSDKVNLSKRMQKILDKSSVTGVDADFKSEDFDKKALINKLHRNVEKYIKEKRPDISRMQMKRNTGNGGMYIWYGEEDCFDVTFTPSINSEQQIALRLWLDCNITRPERLNGKCFDEIMEDNTIMEPLQKLDTVISPLLSEKIWFFHGHSYEGNSTSFPSYVDELRYLHDNGWMSGDITNNPQFWITLEKPSLFEDMQVVSTIGDVVIANYDFRVAMKGWK